ncbi:fluoride efflux transporter CrcB, partial [Escherichia coli]|uniref:fluoride efflux transporter CrcB n=1 Tax=Escherichia coli TaxID=562 RepID=UPI0024C2C0C1
EKRVFLVILFTSFSGSLVSRIPGAVHLPPGTLVVNLLAGLIIGTALAYFLRQPHLDPFWKLMITTGLCGGLSTFSTFSVEVFALLQAGNYIWALTSVLVHVIGSLIMTALGFFIITILFA